MALQDELLKLIQKASIEGTLTPAAVDYTKKLIEENASLTAKLDQHAQRISELTKQHGALADENRALTAAAADVAKREQAVATREKEITKLEMTAANEAKRVEDHKAMFSLVFRNLEMRRNVFTAVPATPASSGAYQTGSSAYVHEGPQTERSE